MDHGGSFRFAMFDDVSFSDGNPVNLLPDPRIQSFWGSLRSHFLAPYVQQFRPSARWATRLHRWRFADDGYGARDGYGWLTFRDFQIVHVANTKYQLVVWCFGWIRYIISRLCLTEKKQTSIHYRQHQSWVGWGQLQNFSRPLWRWGSEYQLP